MEMKVQKDPKEKKALQVKKVIEEMLDHQVNKDLLETKE